MGRVRLPILICLAMVLALAVNIVTAGQTTIAGVTVTTPATHASCVDAKTTDTVSITGLTGSGLRVSGQIIVAYSLTGPDLQLIETIPVNTTVDQNVVVTYPPVSEWPAQADSNPVGMREIHVDVQLELFDASNVKLGTFGPGIDWDVFCQGEPPTDPPTGGEGCTPGFWKQDQHFDSYPAPYTPTTTFNSVFGVGPNIGLAQAAGTGGGGENALLRHATAALLNAASADVDYKFTVAQVIAMVQNAYATGDFEPTKNIFEAENQAGCPLS